MTVAKPKSSRNSSIESFVVCRRFSPPPDFVPSMTALLQGHKYDDSDSSVLPLSSFCSARYGPGNEILGLSNLVVPFVACGDLSGFDSDKSYPLQLTGVPSHMTLLMRNTSESTEESSSSTSPSYVYTYHEPVQPPIKPNYHTYQTQVQNNQNQKSKKVTIDI